MCKIRRRILRLENLLLQSGIHFKTLVKWRHHSSIGTSKCGKQCHRTSQRGPWILFGDVGNVRWHLPHKSWTILRRSGAKINRYNNSMCFSISAKVPSLSWRFSSVQGIQKKVPKVREITFHKKNLAKKCYALFASKAKINVF